MRQNRSTDASIYKEEEAPLVLAHAFKILHGGASNQGAYACAFVYAPIWRMHLEIFFIIFIIYLINN